MNWLGSFLYFLGVGGILITVNYSTTLTCQRVELKNGNCQLKQSSLWDSTTREFSLENLQAAQVEEYDDTSRVVLLTKAGTIPLSNFYSNWVDKYGIANDINSFVKDADRRSLEVNQNDLLALWLLLWLFGVLYLLWRLLILLGWLLLWLLILLGWLLRWVSQKFRVLANKKNNRK